MRKACPPGLPWVWCLGVLLTEAPGAALAAGPLFGMLQNEGTGHARSGKHVFSIKLHPARLSLHIV